MTHRLRTLAIIAFVVIASSRSGYADGPQAIDRADNPHGPLKIACETCHGPAGWRPAKISPSFDHAKFRFALDGTHAQTECRACHISLVFRQAATACVSCHQDAHRGELGDDCARCHTPRSFLDRERMRRAHLTTRFPLSGAHLGADCEACHVLHTGLMYVNTPTDCVSCHLQDYNATRNPNHVLGGFSQHCADCHRTITFHEVKP